MLDFEAPNLDCFVSPEELLPYRNVFRNLAQYCEYKRKAMWNRSRGDIAQAMHFEKCCELLYQELPEEVRW